MACKYNMCILIAEIHIKIGWYFFLILLKDTVHFSRIGANLHWAVRDGVSGGNLRGHHFTI